MNFRSIQNCFITHKWKFIHSKRAHCNVSKNKPASLHHVQSITNIQDAIRRRSTLDGLNSNENAMDFEPTLSRKHPRSMENKKSHIVNFPINRLKIPIRFANKTKTVSVNNIGQLRNKAAEWLGVSPERIRCLLLDKEDRDHFILDDDFNRFSSTEIVTLQVSIRFRLNTRRESRFAEDVHTIWISEVFNLDEWYAHLYTHFMWPPSFSEDNPFYITKIVTRGQKSKDCSIQKPFGELSREKAWEYVVNDRIFDVFVPLGKNFLALSRLPRYLLYLLIWSYYCFVI